METPYSLVERWARLELQLLCPTWSTSTGRDAPIERPNLTRTLTYASRIGCLERRLLRRSFKGLTSNQINSPDDFTTSKSDTYFSTLYIPSVTTYHHAFILCATCKKLIQSVQFGSHQLPRFPRKWRQYTFIVNMTSSAPHPCNSVASHIPSSRNISQNILCSGKCFDLQECPCAVWGYTARAPQYIHNALCLVLKKSEFPQTFPLTISSYLTDFKFINNKRPEQYVIPGTSSVFVIVEMTIKM
jgi:hypothetical protein